MLAALALIVAASLQSKPGVRPSAWAPRIDPAAAPKIDGDLSDKCWESAPAIGSLRQKEPLENSEPTERTEVRVVHDGRNLYFGFSCFDSAPDRIRATQMRRDADPSPDDRVEILLDTLHDFRNAYFFAVGAGGTLQDALLSQNGAVSNSAWDGVWSAKTRITAQGWFAEVAIPFRTIASDASVSTWGLNIERFIRRKREELVWSSPFHDFVFERVSESGELRGIENIEVGLGLDVVPYVKGTANRSRMPDDTDLLGAGGGELFYRLTPGITGALTANTDFAETEVDDRQVNLTRFPLFFPEKRKFFLEDAGVFSFESAARSQDLLPFFSRRIGLDPNGNRIPIDAGAKLSGYAGDWSGGFIGVETGDRGRIASSELFAGRVRANIDATSSLGGIVTSGNPLDGRSNQTAGVDYRYSTGSFAGGKNLDISAYFLKSFTDGVDGNDRAMGAEVSYPNDYWQWRARAREIGDDFFPALGFVQRTGIRQYDGTLALKPRPGGELRQCIFKIDPNVITDLSGRVSTATMATTARAIMDSGDDVGVIVTPVYDRVEQPFDIVPNLPVAPDAYSYFRYRVRGETAGKRPWLIASGFEWGDFDGGRRYDLDNRFEWRPAGAFNAAVESSTTWLRLPGGDADVQIGRVRSEVNFSTEMSWQSLVQFDNVSKDAGVNSRFRWILEPGKDLFLVFNHSWIEVADHAVVPDETGLVVKLVVTLRF